MALFDEVQFPSDISRGAKQGPEFMTLVVSVSSGAEQRVGLWANGRLYFDVSYSVKSPSQMAAVVAFFRARQGRLRGFRFKDWTDYRAAGEALVNPYPAAVIQLQKTYSSGGVQAVRRIAKPVNNGTFKLYKGGVLQTLTTHYTIDYTTGIVTLVTPTAGAMYTWDGEFDVPARFDTDRLQYEAEDVGIQNCDAIPIVEVPL